MIFAPYFVEYHFYVENHQGVSKVVPTDAQFNLDLEAIAQALSPRTKMLLINSPNNPSGVVYPAATIQALGMLLQQKQVELGTQIYLVSDEPYKKLLYDGMVYPEVYPHYVNSIAVTSHAKDLACLASALAILPRIQAVLMSRNCKTVSVLPTAP
jgi:aspartate aminotransferase